MALASEVRKTVGLVHNLTTKNEHQFSTSGDEAEHADTVVVIPIEELRYFVVLAF